MPRGSEGLPEMHVHQEPQNVTLCGNRIFAEVPKGQMEMRTSWGGWGLSPVPGVLVGDRRGPKETHGRSHRKTESGETLSQARSPWSHQKLEEPGRSPLRALGGSMALRTP